MTQSQTLPLSIAKRGPLARLLLRSIASVAVFILILKSILDLPFQVPTSRPPAPARPVQIRSLSGNVPNVRCRPSAGSRCPPSSAGRGEDEEEEDATQGWQCSGGNSARRTPRARASVIQDSIGIMTNRDARARRRRRHGLCVPGHPGPSLRHSSPLSWH